MWVIFRIFLWKVQEWLDQCRFLQDGSRSFMRVRSRSDQGRRCVYARQLRQGEWPMPHTGGKRPGSSGAQHTTTRLLVFFVLGALAAGISSFLVPCATASPGTTVLGTYTETVDNFRLRQAGGNFIVDFTATVQFTGG